MQASRFQNNNYLRFGIQSIRKINPCCGCSLQTGAKIIALVQLSLACMMSFGVILAIIVVLAVHEAKMKEVDESTIDYWKHKLGLNLLLTICIIFLLLLILLAFLHRYLYKAIQQRNYKKVNIWWVTMFALTMFFLIQNIIMAIKSKGETTFGIAEILNLVFDVYSLWVIYEYKTELTASLTDPTVEFERVL